VTSPAWFDANRGISLPRIFNVGLGNTGIFPIDPVPLPGLMRIAPDQTKSLVTANLANIVNLVGVDIVSTVLLSHIALLFYSF
jgi:hypothetical protein